ncbi:MAG: hypothetical protein H0X38_08615 [Planctomycetes bacterium]|nr:hypothetical protein [Planctomycetota bacterium]
MLVVSLRCLLLLIIASPMFGAAGDGTRSLTNLVFGPVVFLVAALGILSCLYQFARGNKSAAFFILGGLFFLGIARALLKGWLDPSSGAGFTMNLGKFPVYGEAEAADAGGKHFYGFVASWAYIGLTVSHALSMATLSLGIPVLIAIVGAWPRNTSTTTCA